LGIFDFLKRAKEKPVAAAGELQEREFTVDALDSALAEKERGAMAPAVDEGSGLCREIAAAAQEAARAARSLEGAEPTGQWSKIGEEMKRNFLERIPAVLALEAPREKNYESLAAFHSSAFRAMASAAKIVSDNRYLLHFFPKQMSEFSRRANAVVALVEKLAKALADGRAKAAAFSAARAEIERHRRLVKEKQLLEKELEKLGVPAPGAGGKRKGSEGGKVSSAGELAELDARIASLRAKLASAANPLERPLRKLERTCLDKRIASAAKEFAADPVAAVLEKGAGEMRSLALELERELAAGHVESDEKKRERLEEHLHGIDYGAVEKAVGELRSLSGARREAERRVREEARAERELADADSEARETEAKRRGTAEKIAEKQGESEASLREVAESAGRVLGARIKMLG